jgi:hypothetical protein
LIAVKMLSGILEHHDHPDHPAVAVPAGRDSSRDRSRPGPGPAAAQRSDAARQAGAAVPAAAPALAPAVTDRPAAIPGTGTDLVPQASARCSLPPAPRGTDCAGTAIR